MPSPEGIEPARINCTLRAYSEVGDANLPLHSIDRIIPPTRIVALSTLPSPPTLPTPIDLSIIIVSWNVRDLLGDCLRSIRRHTHRCTYEVWVVDNGSQDDTPAMVRQAFPDVRLIAGTDNLGFAQANNLAYARASGRYVALLNPDTVLLGDAFDRMVAYLDAHPDCGAVGPRLSDADGALQYSAAGNAPTLHTELQRIRGRDYRSVLKTPGSDYTRTVEVLCGACMVIRREGFEGTLLNEAYFMYSEDVELCWEIRERMGRTITYLREAEVCHLGKQSSIQVKGMWAERAHSTVLYFRHTRGPADAALVRAIQVIYALVQIARRVVWRIKDPTLGRDETRREMRELWGIMLWALGLRRTAVRRRQAAWRRTQ